MPGAIRTPLAAILLAGCLAGASRGASPAVYGRLDEVFADFGVRGPAFAQAAVTKSLRREGRSHLFWTVVAGLGRRTIRIEITTNLRPGAAGRLIDERAVVVRALYKPATVDYFGVMSGRAVVPDELRPVVLYPERSLLHSGNPVFILWAQKDFSYAVHDRSEAAYRGLLAFRYCEAQRTLLQVETFEPAAVFDKEAALRDLSQLRCSVVKPHQ
ncbi:MAG: hypothetical protein HY926_09190 [Elusimicrobia bacterium]|nr:hypothetical protein [Elusimicrobiota bacterium]